MAIIRRFGSKGRLMVNGKEVATFDGCEFDHIQTFPGVKVQSQSVAMVTPRFKPGDIIEWDLHPGKVTPLSVGTVDCITQHSHAPCGYAYGIKFNHSIQTIYIDQEEFDKKAVLISSNKQAKVKSSFKRKFENSLGKEDLPDSFFENFSIEGKKADKHPCHCTMNDLMVRGCKCGGI